MGSHGSMKACCRVARPVMSLNCHEAHMRVLSLYKACYRYIPYIVKYFDIPKSENDVRLKLRDLFYKNSHVSDIRVIDILVLKGCMELKEVTHQWQAKYHIMDHWKPTAEPKPCGFVAKFLDGLD